MLKKCFTINKFVRNLCRSVIYNIRNYAKLIPHPSCHKSNFCYHAKSILPKVTNVFVGATLLTTLWYEIGEKEDVKDNLGNLIALAKVALEVGDVDRAKDILRLGVKLSEDHEIYSTVPFLYDVLATIALSQGDINLAQNLIVTAIEKLTLWGYSHNHHYIVDFKLRLARIYSSLGDNGLAKMGFEACLQQMKMKIIAGDLSDETGMLYINTLFWYGIHLLKDDHHDQAKKLINNAYEYSSKIKGLSPKQEMIILYTLSDLNIELGDLETALLCMQNAVILGKGIGSIDMPLCYYKLGSLYEKLGFFDDAQYCYEESKKMATIFGYFDIVQEAETALNDLPKKRK